MTQLSKRILTFSDGTYTVEEFPQSGGEPQVQYYRVPGDIERVNFNSDDLRFRRNLFAYSGDPLGGPVRKVVMEKGAMPAVYRLDPDHHTIVDCYWQWIWRNMNPELSDKKWSTLMGSGLALMNNTGSPPHYNCVLKEPADATKFPRFDQARVMSGALLKGTELMGLLMVETINVNDHSWTVDSILSKPWLWYWWTSINPKGEINYITRENVFGELIPVRVPLVTAQKVSLPLVELHKLPPGMVPSDPRKIP